MKQRPLGVAVTALIYGVAFAGWVVLVWLGYMLTWG